MKKCTGLIGRIFGHDWVHLTHDNVKFANSNFQGVLAVIPKHQADEIFLGDWFVCYRCGAVMGDEK